MGIIKNFKGYVEILTHTREDGKVTYSAICRKGFDTMIFTNLELAETKRLLKDSVDENVRDKKNRLRICTTCSDEGGTDIRTFWASNDMVEKFKEAVRKLI